MHNFADYARAALVLGLIAVLAGAFYLRDSTGILLLIAGMLLAWGLFRALNRISGGALLGNETTEMLIDPLDPAEPIETSDPSVELTAPDEKQG